MTGARPRVVLCEPAKLHHEQKRDRHNKKLNAHPHFSPLDLPFITIAFIFPPFCLKKMKDARECKVLAVLRRWRWNIIRLLATLLLLLLLLLVVLVLQVLRLERPTLQRPEHGESDLLVVRGMRVGVDLRSVTGLSGCGNEHCL